MRTRLLVAVAAAAVALTACSTTDDEAPSTVTAQVPQFTVTSPDVEDGGQIPAAHTADAYGGQCTGDNTPLTLTWTGAPESTAAYAVSMIDIDAGEFAHWLLTDISGSVVGIGPTDLAGATQGHNDSGGTGYFGPCPPGPDHHYVVTVYALDAPLGLEPGFRTEDLEDALKGHVLATASLTGTRSGPA